MFNPIKSHETRLLLHLFDDIRIFTCGRSDLVSLLFNLWNPPLNVPLSKWVDRVVQAWTLWLPNDPVISMHFEKVVYAMYKRCGWDIRTNKTGRAILITDLIEALEKEQKKLQYGEEVSSNIFGALVERIKLILRKHNLVSIFNTKTGITVAELLAHPTIIDMDALSKHDKTLLMGILTAAICEYKLANPSQEITNLLILDEAHYLLGRENASGEAYAGAQLQAINAFTEMLRVVGGTGLGVIIADQSPTSLVPEVMKIVVNMIIHALPSKEDRELVGNYTRCTDSQIDHIAGMQTGEAVVYLQHEGTPKNVKMFQLERFIVGGISKEPVDDKMVADHMKKIVQGHPELVDAEPVPEDIDIQSQPPKNERMVETKSNDKEPREILIEKFPQEIKERISQAVTNSTFKRFWEDRLEKKDVNTLTKLVYKISEKSGDGSFNSHLIVLNYLYQEYSCEDNQHVFEGIAEKIDGEIVG
ncbi:ATP-binding protein [Candidatus Thorarchaeota archaeon]|nr:MAG: ATP-binding protein [Candidatus Thorarchaeota archaeon]